MTLTAPSGLRTRTWKTGASSAWDGSRSIRGRGWCRLIRNRCGCSGHAVVTGDERAAVSGEIVYVPLASEAELDALKGKLAGKIVLLGAMRADPPDITEPLFTALYRRGAGQEMAGDAAEAPKPAAARPL